MADPTWPEPQKIDPTRVKKFWPGPITSLKALVVKIDIKLSWTNHIEGINQDHMNGLKIIKKKFTFKQIKNLVTFQVFGVLHYACRLTIPSERLEACRKV